MRAEATRALAQFKLIVPQRNDGTRAGDEAVCRVERAIERLVEVGLDVSVRFGHGDPVVAALDNYDPRRFDKILVCTLPAGASRWLQTGSPSTPSNSSSARA